MAAAEQMPEWPPRAVDRRSSWTFAHARMDHEWFDALCAGRIVRCMRMQAGGISAAVRAAHSTHHESGHACSIQVPVRVNLDLRLSDSEHA